MILHNQTLGLMFSRQFCFDILRQMQMTTGFSFFGYSISLGVSSLLHRSGSMFKWNNQLLPRAMRHVYCRQAYELYRDTPLKFPLLQTVERG